MRYWPEKEIGNYYQGILPLQKRQTTGRRNQLLYGGFKLWQKPKIS